MKCYNKDVAFDPIAIIHSQIEKQGAKGGFVVTTSSFTENAVKYTEELKSQGVNIELIDGTTLVRYWALGMAEKVKEFNTEQEVLV